MDTIKNIYVSGSRVLIIDSNNKLYLFGHTCHKILGINLICEELENNISGCFYTGIILDEPDTINKFYSKLNYIVIHTKNGKLYFSKNIISDNYIGTINNFSNNIHNNVNNDNNDNDNNEDSDNNDNDSDNNDDNDDDDDDNNDNDDNDDDDDNDDTDYTDTDSDSSANLILNKNTENYDYESMPDLEFNDGRENNNNKFEHEKKIDLELMGIDIDFNLKNNGDILKLKSTANIGESGIDLFQENVIDILLTDKFIFYQIDNNIYMFDPHYIDNATICFIYCNWLLLEKIINGTTYIYYQLIFPFEIEKIYFSTDFMYFKSGKYHHIIFDHYFSNDNNFINNSKSIKWIYFVTDIEFVISDIHVLCHESTIIIKKENIIYKYYDNIANLKKYMEHENIKIIKNNHHESNIYCQIDDKIYTNNHYTEKSGIIDKIYQGKYADKFMYMGIYYLYGHKVYVINNESSKMFFCCGGRIFLNENKITNLVCINESIYFTSNNKLYYLSCDKLGKNKYVNKFKLEQNLSDRARNKYILYSQKINLIITGIKYSDQALVITSNNKYYYYYLNEDGGISSDLFEIKSCEDINVLEINNLVNVNLIQKIDIEYEENISIQIDTNSKKNNAFDKLLIYSESINMYTGIMITYINGGNIGNGNGCKIHFMQDALNIFKQKYLIDHGMRTSFNIPEMEIFTDSELESIGSMLHMIIYHSNSHLSIRLPITLITAIAKRSPNILELEYLAKEEYGDTFINIYNHKYDMETIKSFGYDSYYQCLKNLCKYYENDNEINSKVRNISRKIADGFMDYQYINNLPKMNIPTIDYYLSGNYCIDRKKLIKNLKVTMYNKNTTEKNKQKIKKCTKVFKNIIEDISESQLAIMLKNWSSNTVITDNIYDVCIKNDDIDIYFSTCCTEIHINYNLIKIKNRELLIESLTTPINSFKD
ncbi:hypothetical protein [Powai lake megavirus]|uniref:Uncharacterized protein n=1 Tax=Powai lake megavirus TaxID=1842663 RepID=A0A167RGN9_9VIRU|nr:hypothetical protein QJ849_gp499 [Powai lake megavirus]ANB50661.1 hypothetical protein [Powai lake megavirus]